MFNNSHYEKIQKVYSIWICPDPDRENVNSIAEYGFTQQEVIGNVNEPVENYDKMKVIIIFLNDEGMESHHNIIRLLSTMLSTTEPVEKRKQILESEFNIPMTKEIEEEVLEMCNLGIAVELKGVKQGITQGIAQGKEQSLLESIRNLTETLNITAQLAMDALKIPKSNQALYAAKLDNNS